MLNKEIGLIHMGPKHGKVNKKSDLPFNCDTFFSIWEGKYDQFYLQNVIMRSWNPPFPIQMTWGFTPWTTKSSQGLAKSMIGCWICFGTTSVYNKEKNVIVTMDVQRPQKTYFEAYIIRWHGP